jgi:hypothetical protein
MAILKMNSAQSIITILDRLDALEQDRQELEKQLNIQLTASDAVERLVLKHYVAARRDHKRSIYLVLSEYGPFFKQVDAVAAYAQSLLPSAKVVKKYTYSYEDDCVWTVDISW